MQIWAPYLKCLEFYWLQGFKDFVKGLEMGNSAHEPQVVLGMLSCQWIRFIALEDFPTFHVPKNLNLLSRTTVFNAVICTLFANQRALKRINLHTGHKLNLKCLAANGWDRSCLKTFCTLCIPKKLKLLCWTTVFSDGSCTLFANSCTIPLIHKLEQLVWCREIMMLKIFCSH